MKITSPVFKEGERIPKKYTCEGDNISPPLLISGVPLGTKSLAIVVRDSDAPSGGFLHWIMWNIDPGVSEIPEGKAPFGVEEGINDSGDVGWAGPCPPSGKHHYEFCLYALGSLISGFSSNASNRVDIQAFIEEHTLEKASLVGLYERSFK